MTITITMPKEAQARNQDSPSQDSKPEKITYRYDLELDEKFNIVGGEWHQQGKDSGPGYAFIPPPKAYVGEKGVIDDVLILDWLPNSPPPTKWLEPARWHSKHERLPLGQVVETLIKRSKHPPPVN